MITNRTASVRVPAELDSALKRLAAIRDEAVDDLLGEILRDGLRARGLLDSRADRVGQAHDIEPLRTRNFR